MQLGNDFSDSKAHIMFITREKFLQAWGGVL